MRQDFRRAPARNDSAHRFYIRAQQIRYAAELFQQPLRRSRPHTWYFVQDALRLPPSATLAWPILARIYCRLVGRSSILFGRFLRSRPWMNVLH